MEPTHRSKMSTGFYLAIASLSVGWMIGLSVSPVVNIIVSSVIVVLVSTVTLLGGLNLGEDQKVKITRGSVQTLPLAILTLFIAIGASVGIYARTHEWLGKKTAATETNSAAPSAGNDRADQVAGLYASMAKKCELLSLQKGDDLRKALINLQDHDIDSIMQVCTTDSCLLHLKNLICGPEK